MPNAITNALATTIFHFMRVSVCDRKCTSLLGDAAIKSLYSCQAVNHCPADRLLRIPQPGKTETCVGQCKTLAIS